MIANKYLLIDMIDQRFFINLQINKMLTHTFNEPFLFREPYLFILYFNIVPFVLVFSFPLILFSYKKQKLIKFTSIFLFLITNLFLYLVFDAVYNEFNDWDTNRIIEEIIDTVIWIFCNNLFPIAVSIILIKRKNNHQKN